jgi:hypothetical protein
MRDRYAPFEESLFITFGKKDFTQPSACGKFIDLITQTLHMKNVIISLMLIAFSSPIHSSTEPSPAPNKSLPFKATEVYIPIGKTGQLISVWELSQIRVKDFEKVTGKKMNFVEKVNFKSAQRQLRKNINRDGSFSSKYEKYFSPAAMSNGAMWGGLALGLFLSLIGVLIAYLIKTGDTKKRIKWAWIGAAISLILWGALVI